MFSPEKIKTREELAALAQELRRQGKKIGFTSGAFDLLHAGHVDYLEKAKALCDVLIVGVNSDASVRAYKGPHRPITSQEERARVVAALTAVDYVFIFDERRNQKNIEAFRPHLYVKAGDYTEGQLTSKETVEALGGEVQIIPVTVETSTSRIVQQIVESFGEGKARVVEEEGAVYLDRKRGKSSPAIFLDRDGTINKEVEYLSEPEKFELLPNALAGLKKLQDMGFRLVIVTTQGGIGLGYFAKEDFYRVNREMFRQLAPARVRIDKIYFCPHSIVEGCDCRKPQVGLLRRAKEDLNLDFSHSYTIGDKTSDIEAGRRAGTRTILLKTGHGGQDNEYAIQPDYVAEDLLDAANYILEQQRQSQH